MNKLFLTGLIGLVAIGANAENLIVERRAMDKISPNGQWAASTESSTTSSTDYTYVWNPGSGSTDINTYSGIRMGYGNAIADNGTIVGYSLSGTTGTPKIIYNGNVSTLSMSHRDSDGSFFPMAVSKNADKIVGYCGNDNWVWYYADLMMMENGTRCLTHLPFVADLSGSAVSNVTLLPLPEYNQYDEILDLFGAFPARVTAEWISEDGNTIVGLAFDMSNMYGYPVVWKKNGSTWGQPTFPTVDKITDEVPHAPVVKTDPSQYNAPYPEYGQESSGELLKYLNNPAKREFFDKIAAEIGWGPDCFAQYSEDENHEYLGRDYVDMGPYWSFATTDKNIFAWTPKILNDEGEKSGTLSGTYKLGKNAGQSYSFTWTAKLQEQENVTNKKVLVEISMDNAPEGLEFQLFHGQNDATVNNLDNPSATSTYADGKYTILTSSSFAATSTYKFGIRMSYDSNYDWLDFMDEADFEAFKAACVEYDTYDYWTSFTKYAYDMEIFVQNNPFFSDHKIVINPSGDTAACTQEHPGGGDGSKSTYTIWSVNLNTGDFKRFDSKYNNLIPNQVLNTGDILAYNDGQTVGYVRRTDANEFIPMHQYLKATNPEVAVWMEENLDPVTVSTGVIDESTGSMFTELVTATGVVNMTEDRTIIIGGINNEEADGDDEEEVIKKHSYYLSDLGTTIVAAPEGAANYKDGTNVPGLNGLKLNWDYQDFTLNESKLADVKVIFNDSDEVKVLNAVKEEGEKGYELALTFEEYTQGGDVVISIPEDLVDVNCWGLGTHGNATMTLNYHAAAVLPAPTVDPEGGVVTELPTTITLTWPEGVTLSRTPNAAYTIALLHNGDELEVAIDEVTFSNNVITVTLFDGFVEPGAYTLAVSAGYGTDAETGDMTPEVNVVYHLVGAVAHVSVSPQNGATLSEEAKVVVTWHDVVALHPDAVNKPTVSANVRSADEIEPVLNGNNMEFDLSHLENGRYTLEIPEMYVTVGNEGYWNDVVTLVYTIDVDTTGIGDLENEAADGYHVYNLQGVNVLNTYNASDLKSLAPGIYVVNGKKVAIR